MCAPAELDRHRNTQHPTTTGPAAPALPWARAVCLPRLEGPPPPPPPPPCRLYRHRVPCLVAGVTILLSLTVFLNLVAAMMPNTSDAVPLIGMLPGVSRPRGGARVLTLLVTSTHHGWGSLFSRFSVHFWLCPL